MRASVGPKQWRTISVANHTTARTHRPANFSFKPEFYFVLRLFAHQVFEAKRVANNSTAFFVTWAPEFNKMNTSLACRYVKSGFMRANVHGKNRVSITRLRQLMTTVGRDFKPWQANAIAQQLSHYPKRATARYQLPQRAKKSVQTVSLLETALRYRALELEEDSRVASPSELGMPSESGMPQSAASSSDDIASNFVASLQTITSDLLPSTSQAVLAEPMPCSSEEALTTLQTSVSKVATNKNIDFDKIPKSKEAFVALFWIFVKSVDKAASEKKAKALHKRLGLNQWNFFQTNHHWVYLCLEEAANERWGLDMANVLTQYAPTAKDARSQFYYYMLIGSQFALTLTSTKVDLDGQLERPPSYWR